MPDEIGIDSDNRSRNSSVAAPTPLTAMEAMHQTRSRRRAGSWLNPIAKKPRVAGRRREATMVLLRVRTTSLAAHRDRRRRGDRLDTKDSHVDVEMSRLEDHHLHPRRRLRRLTQQRRSPVGLRSLLTPGTLKKILIQMLSRVALPRRTTKRTVVWEVSTQVPTGNRRKSTNTMRVHLVKVVVSLAPMKSPCRRRIASA